MEELRSWTERNRFLGVLPPSEELRVATTFIFMVSGWRMPSISAKMSFESKRGVLESSSYSRASSICVAGVHGLLQ